ncbi:peptidylprolyl isomerase [Salegentibacter sp. F188]|uniref:Peptidylprolyl isomerase n=1 Tax=Autumnicola patrickiae TaxID=3075591 RepID=A0ABU3E6J7_9FLAO|nr:peptidylprolyl isomerase [Salegentibacter sp. F188]MDT0691555.1 peptidylprolyl isomerase [Salegentibacter sp. F188]
MNLKFLTRITTGILLMLFVVEVQAQEVIVTDSTAIQPKEEIAESITRNTNERRRVEGIAAVVGDYIILDSDIDLMYKQMQSQNMSTANVTECNLAGSLMENKLYAHHAVQDSIVVLDADVRSYIDQQIAEMSRQLGSVEKVVEYYNKESEAELRTELFEINKERQLSSRMQQKIVESVEVTPEEVRAYFEEMQEDELPIFSDEVEIAQIVVRPEIPESEKQKVIDRLNEFRADVVDNDASFRTKAILYSDDTNTGGTILSLGRKDNFVKEFKDVAFSLQEREVSEPFQTEFGFHIIEIDKIRGQQVDLRHILLIPGVTNATVEKAKSKIDTIRKRISEGKLEFAEAAKEFSDEEETRNDGGKLRNPQTGDTKFELTKLDPKIYNQVVNLEEGEMSLRISDSDDTGKPFFKLLKVVKRIPEHEANYATDYLKIKDLALQAKQLEAIEEWQTEKITDTYIKVNSKFRDCEYSSNWLKK